MKSKIFKLLLILPIISFLTSCLRYNEEATLYRDFSGVATVEVLLPKMLAEDKDVKEMLYNLDEFEDKLKKKRDIKLIKIKRAIIGPDMKIFVRYSFDSIDNMNVLFISFMNEFWKAANLEEFTKVNHDGRKIKYERVIEKIKTSNSLDSKEDDAFLKMVQAGFTSFTISFKTKFPYKVVKTNGIMFDDDRTVEWSFTPYDLILKDIKMEVEMEKFDIFNKQNLFR